MTSKGGIRCRIWFRARFCFKLGRSCRAGNAPWNGTVCLSFSKRIRLRRAVKLATCGVEEDCKLTTDGKVTGYSPLQVTLHWSVVVLVAFQFVAHDGIEDSWRAFRRDEAMPADALVLTYLHVAAGILVLLLALARIYLRLTRGVPAPPPDEPRVLHLVAEAVHGSIYLLLLLLPVTGLVAWFLGVKLAGDAHALLQNLLLAAIALHIAGALFQHFVLRSQVLMRMFRPDPR